MTPSARPLWTLLERELDRFPEEVRDLPVLSAVTPRELRSELAAAFDLERPRPLPEVTGEVIRLLRSRSVHVTHPRYFGLFNPSVREAGIVGDTLAALYNPQLAVWSHAPGAQEIERLVLSKLATLLGLPPGGLAASFTSGGAEANLQAVLSALAHRFPAWAEEGVAALPGPPVLYLSQEAHHSFVKIARMAGLGTRSVRRVAVTGRWEMDPDALARAMAEDRHAGRHPLLVVGTAGTTSSGAVDPLPRLAEIAGDGGAWFHVDAAWGGLAALVPRLAPLLAGVERADSVTWDAHKGLSVPMGAGMFFCRHLEAVRHAFAVATSYMPGRTGTDTLDPYATTAQWSRRAIGIKVFLALAELGIAGYRELLGHQAAMGDRLRALLAGAGWSLANDTPLPLVCFSHPDLEAGRTTTRRLLGSLYRGRRVWISDVVLGGRRRVLRACIPSFRTDEGDLEVLLEELERARRETRRRAGGEAGIRDETRS